MPPKQKQSSAKKNIQRKRSRKPKRIEEDEQASDASAWPPSSSNLDASNLDGDDTPEHSSAIPTVSRFPCRSDPTKFASQERVFAALDVAVVKGTDLSKPLKATCNALQSVLQMVPEYIEKEEWRRLIKMLRFHLATVENQLVKLDEDQEIEGSALPFDPVVTESLQAYASKLKEIYIFMKNEGINVGDISGILGKGLQDFDEVFLKYTRALHLLVASRVEQTRNSLSQADHVFMSNATSIHSSRVEDINVYGVQHRQCLPGTRIKTLDAIRHWENDENSTNQMFCLLDFAGSGKSTVSKHMDLEWDRERKLMARFFFSRDTAETMSTKRFCSVVANKFASRDETFREVMREFENQPDYGSLSLEQQFDGLIVDPLKALNRRAILIIDALDECDNDHGHRDRLLEVISNHLSAIPHLRVFVTGRPELDIKQWAITTDGVRCTNFFELEGNNDDVGRYIKQRLRSWPSSLQARVYDIVERAEGVFIWARIACDLLCKTKDVQAMLASLSEEVTLDHLYTIALEQSIPKDKHSRRVAVMVLEMILALRRPLSIAEVAQLSPNPEAIEAVVNSLGSILLYKDRNDPIRLIHATLREYLTSATKSGPWFVQLGRGHYFLASGCIDLATRAKQGPGPDIEEGTFKRKELFDKMIRSIINHLCSAIRYSWDSWIAHCEESSCKLGLNERIVGFIDTGYEYLLDDSLRAVSDQFITNVVSLCRRNMVSLSEAPSLK
ncbi:hypothetical protein FRC14_003106 [Serendipita sp. 396]|nr:hypothetical protein FRC14_003106 [Serendipita sp. 396]KAG8777561.1 hypothetical protein FRC15_011269 [Serendipita sp. 397]KAG8801291.1 hypothetical protein FRC16_000814 [Serendipita sp. 398]KAG8869573.1 hypothetical protein FRC20_001205 [Serendipita sp. 405]